MSEAEQGALGPIPIIEDPAMKEAAATIVYRAGLDTWLSGNYAQSWTGAKGVRLVSEQAVTTILSLAEKAMGRAIDYEALISNCHDNTGVTEYEGRTFKSDVIEVAREKVLEEFEDRGRRIYSDTESAVSRLAVQRTVNALGATHSEFDALIVAALVDDHYAPDPEVRLAVDELAMDEPTSYDFALLEHQVFTEEDYAAGERSRIEQLKKAPEGWND